MNSSFAGPPEGPLTAASVPAIKALRDQVVQVPSALSDPEFASWQEKLIRLVELNRRRLPSVFRERFQSAPGTAGLVLEVLSNFALGGPQGVPDCRALNAALWLLDESAEFGDEAFFSDAAARIEKLVARLPGLAAEREQSWGPAAPTSPELAGSFDVASMAWRSEDAVVVFASHARALHVLGTIHLLQNSGVRISHVFVRRLLSPMRLREELAFSPRFLAKRVFNEIVRRRSDTPSRGDSASLQSWMEEIGCEASSVRDLVGRDSGKAAVRWFSDFNSPECVAELRAIAPTYGVFCGGGVLRPEVLEPFGKGVVHAHPGVLPAYRGMDVVQWAILEGAASGVGATVQLMSPVLDGGQLLSQLRVNYESMSNLNEIRTAVVTRKAVLLSDTLVAYATGQCPPSSAGRLLPQYRLMHPKLVNVVHEIIAEQATSSS